MTTFLINHFDLFGLRQAWLHFHGLPQEPAAVRHADPLPHRATPALCGLVVGVLGAPTMSVAHLLFAAVTTAYILVAIQLEERDLMDAHPEYSAYRVQVPMLVPAWRQRPIGTDAAREAGA